MSISEQEHQRRQSLEDIIQLGLNPYPSEIFTINSSSEEIKNNFDEKKSNFNEVKVAGRLMSRRIMGSASFAEIQDSKGRIQIYVRRDDICPSEDKTLYNILFKKKLDLGDIIGIEGYVFLTKMGEITIHVTDLKILSKSIRPLPVGAVLAIMHKNVETAQKVLKKLASEFKGKRSCDCGSAAKNSVVTDPKSIPDQLKDELSILFG